MTAPRGNDQYEQFAAQPDPRDPAIMQSAQNRLLRLQNVSKSFSGRLVLSGVGLEVPVGRIHGLVGNNGAGKSTLVKVITGTYSASPGSSIAICGHVVESGLNEQLAHQLGIRVVHQEAPLIDSFTVAEMVAVLRGYPTRFGFVRWRQLRQETRRLLSRFGIRVDPDARAAFLSAAERALVTLAIALGDTGGEDLVPMVILDEATASVPAEEAKLYLDAVRGVAEGGGGVLMVSHRLQEIVHYCDSVTVLSDGHVVYDGTTSGLSVRELSEYMARDVRGESASAATLAPRSLPSSWGFEESENGAARAATPSVLKVVDLRGPMVHGVSLTVGPGEIVGLSGLFGSGVSEIGRLIAGVEAATGGIIQLDGSEPLVLRGRVHRALKSGIAYLSSDRAREGGIATLSMQENAVLPTVSRYWGKRVVERMRIKEAISLLDVRPQDPLAPFGVLSGGNQQKILLAKILLTRPRLVVLDDPTVGVDPQSREIIFAVLREVVESGRGALISSSEPDQLARICNRVLIIDRGRITRELVGSQVTATDIMLAGS